MPWLDAEEGCAGLGPKCEVRQVFEVEFQRRAALGFVGQAIARKAKELGIETVVFDRGGYLYHGRVKAVAEGAREGGLNF